MRTDYVFNPANQYGDYVVVSDPDPSDDVVQEAIATMLPQALDVVTEEYIDDVTWTVEKNTSIIDPETQTEIPCCLVYWKYNP